MREWKVRSCSAVPFFCVRMIPIRMISVIVAAVILVNGSVGVLAAQEKPQLQLNALSACLLDADSGRVLYGKNENDIRAMASTTKIMTLIVILENASLDDVVTISKNAAIQPDVQLNVNTGEQYVLKDLLYSLMLESHNDVAVALAEHVGGSVEGFAGMMNEKAKELGLDNTYFITPNGLDARDEHGMHSTTAVDLARLAAYAIQNDTFVEITNTRTHSFSEVNGKRSFTVNNKNQFLSMMDGAIGVKTGFTGEAGYCFVGAIKQDGRTLISVVLGSGWPPNKTLKWKDTRTLMQFGMENYFPQIIYEEHFLEKIPVENGDRDFVEIGARGKVAMLLSRYDDVKIYYEHVKKLTAPVLANVTVGHIYITVNGVVVEILDIKTLEESKEADFLYYLRETFNIFLPF